MARDYFLSEGGSLAQRLDKAWRDYKNSSKSEEDRIAALNFMVYVLDINKFTNESNVLNKILRNLMAERSKKKLLNPDYIPILTSGKYQFVDNARILYPTRSTKVSIQTDIQTAFDSGELLDVNANDKLRDKNDGITYLSSRQRAEYAIEIFNGLFHKDGEVFDSFECIAHGKSGFVAFTLNTNGELSVFDHVFGEHDTRGRHLTHSSMNSGAPVLSAGEMKIRNGKLSCINTFSGHYRPSLYSIARFLEYLSDRGIDISKTRVYLQSQPDPLCIKSKQVELIGDDRPWFRVPANEIVCSVKAIMKSNLSSLDDYLKSTKTALLSDLFKSDLTKTKIAIAKDFYDELVLALDFVRDSSSLRDTKISLNCLEAIISKYTDRLEYLEEKKGRLDKKFGEMRAQINGTRKYIEGFAHDENTRMECFKKAF